MNHYFHISLVEYLFKLAYYLPQCGILMKIPEGYKRLSLLLDGYVVKKLLRSPWTSVPPFLLIELVKF